MMDQEFEEILTSELSETDKLVRAFFNIFNQQRTYTEAEIELQKAVGDQQELVKQQIKLETLKHSTEILKYCYYRVTKRKWIDD